MLFYVTHFPLLYTPHPVFSPSVWWFSLSSSLSSLSLSLSRSPCYLFLPRFDHLVFIKPITVNTSSHSVYEHSTTAKTVFEFMILLPQLFHCWYCKYVHQDQLYSKLITELKVTICTVLINFLGQIIQNNHTKRQNILSVLEFCEDRSFCPVQPCWHSVPRKHTEAYIINL